MNHRRTILLDRDGTVIVERFHLSDPQQVELLPGAAEGLRRMQARGWRLIVITNQAGIGKGLFSPERLAKIHQRMNQLLAEEGVVLDGIYWCPHTADDGCDCRKPRTGMIRRAAAEHGFDPCESVLIGDKASDIDSGRNAGAAAILVRTGYGAEVERSGTCQPDAVVDDLQEAASYIERI